MFPVQFPGKDRSLSIIKYYLGLPIHDIADNIFCFYNVLLPKIFVLNPDSSVRIVSIYSNVSLAVV